MPMRCKWMTALAIVAAWIVAGGLSGQSARAEDRASQWQGYERLDFQVDGRDCLLIVPKEPAAGKPWIWRTEFFGHEPQGDLALVGKGFHVAYIDVQNMYGAPVALDHMDRFYDHLTRERGLGPKPVLEGFSRGGLFSLNWAAGIPTESPASTTMRRSATSRVGRAAEARQKARPSIGSNAWPHIA